MQSGGVKYGNQERFHINHRRAIHRIQVTPLIVTNLRALAAHLGDGITAMVMA